MENQDSRLKTHLNYFNLIVLPLLLLFSSCENEKFDAMEPLESIKNGIEIEYITGDDIPEVIGAITNLKDKSSARTSLSKVSLINKKALVDFKNVTKIKNKDNITNYTFKVTTQDTIEGVFYNLIVNETPNGKIKDPYILKYTVDKKALPDFLANNRDFRYFKGKREIIAFKDFFDTDTTISRTTTSDCPDSELPFDNTISTGGGGGFYSIPDDSYLQTFPDYYDYYTNQINGESYWLYLNTYDNGESTSHVDIVGNTIVPISFLTTQGPTTLTVDVSINATYGYNSYTSITFMPNYNGPDGGSGTSTCKLVTVITLSDSTTFSFEQTVDCASYQLRTTAPPEGDSVGDCPEPDGGIAITLDNLRYDIIETLGISGTLEGKYILKLATLNQLEDVTNYLNENTDLAGNIDPEAKDFGKEAVRAWLDFGEVDFPNKVILDPTFVNNEKLKCVYDKLTKDNNPLFRNTVGAFINDPKFNLTFKVGNCATTNDQCTNDSDPYNIVITFEDTSGNPIEIAQAILHEAIHAEITRFIKLFQSGVDTNNRPYLFQLYAYYKDWADNVDPNFNWSNAADHQYMITNYIKKITEALRQFDDYRYPLANYKDYAWDGLRKYDYRGTLTETEEASNINLRATQTNIGITVCN